MDAKTWIKRNLVIAISAVTLLAVCFFVTLTLLYYCEEISDFDSAKQMQPSAKTLNLAIAEPRTEDRLREISSNFRKYGQIMTDIFNQYGYEVQFENSYIDFLEHKRLNLRREYTAYIDSGSFNFIDIRFSYSHRTGREEVAIVYQRDIYDEQDRHQGANVDLWSDLLHTLSGGQISPSEVEHFFSDDYKSMPLHEIESEWLYRPENFTPAEKTKVREGQLCGMRYDLLTWDDGAGVLESLSIIIFHLGGIEYGILIR